MKKARRRWVVWLAVCGVLAGLWVARGPLAAWILRRSQEQFVQRLEQATGIRAEIGGIRATWLPPGVLLREIRLIREGRKVATVGSVRASLRLLPLLRRKLEADTLIVESPDLELDPETLTGLGVQAGGVGPRIGLLWLRNARCTWTDTTNGRRGRIGRADAVSVSFLTGDRIDLWVRASGVEAEAPGAALREGTFQGRVQADAGGWGIRLANASALTPWGRVDVRGRVEERGGRWRAEGTAGSPRVWIQGTPLDRLRADLRAEDGQVALDSLRGKLWGGDLGGALRLRREGDARWYLEGDVGLDGFSPAAIPFGTERDRRLAGRMASLGAVELRGSLPLEDPFSGAGSFALRLTPLRAGGSSVPVRAGIEGRLADRRVAIDRAEVSLPGAELAAAGTLEWDGPVDLGTSIDVRDLGDLLPVLLPWIPSLARVAGWEPRGAIHADGRIAGTLSGPVFAGRCAGTDLRIRGVPVGSLGARLHATRRSVEVVDGALQGPVAGLAFSGKAWGAEGDGEVRWELERADPGRLAEALGEGVDWKGSLGGKGTFRWTADGPRLEGRVAGRGASVRGHDLDSLDVPFVADREGVCVEGASVGVAGGRLAASGCVRWNGEGLDLRVTGETLGLARLSGIDALGGSIRLEGEVTGSLQEPRPRERVVLHAEEVRYREFGPLNLAGELRAEGDGWALDLDPRQGAVGGSLVVSQAEGFPYRLSLEVPRLEARARGEGGWGGTAEGGRLRCEGVLTELRGARCTAEVSVVRAGEGDRWEARSLEPLRATLADGRVDLAASAVGIGGQRAVLQGWAEIEGPLRWGASLEGTVELRGVPGLPASVHLGGKAEVQLVLRGEGKRVNYEGTLRWVDGYARLEGFPASLERAHAWITLDAAGLRLDDLRGSCAGGRVRGYGQASLEQGTLGRLRIELEGEAVSIRYPPGLRALGDFRLVLEGPPGGLRLGGRVEVTRARFEKKLAIERSLLSGEPPPTPVPPRGKHGGIELDIAVHSDGTLRVDTDLARARMGADLLVRGTTEAPRLDGRIATVESGRARLFGRNYTLLAAGLEFTGQENNDPLLDLFAAGRIDPYELRILVEGRLSAPRIGLYTDPELPQEQVLALLLTGSADVGLPGAAGAVATGDILRTGAGIVGSALGMGAGLDVFRVDPVAAEGSRKSTARVTFGEHIGTDLLATVSVAMDRPEAPAISLYYRPWRRIELRQTRDETGSYSAEVRYLRSFYTGKRPGAGPREVEGPWVGGLLLRGAPEPPGEVALREKMELAPGSAAGERELLQAAERARSFLMESGYPVSHATCAQSSGPVREGEFREGGVPVVCTLDAGPRVVLSLEGLGPKAEKKIREAIEEEWEGLDRAEDLRSGAAETTREWLLEAGHAWAEVNASELEEQSARHITLRVRPGPLVRVRSVAIEGAREVPEEEVRKALDAARKGFLRGALLTPSLLAHDRAALEGFFYGRGFLDAQIAEPRVERLGGGGARAVFAVEEGKRYRLGGIEFEGATVFGREELLRTAALTPGAPLEPLEGERIARSLESDYDRMGRPATTVEWGIERRGEGSASLRFRIREGPEVRVGAIRIAGLVHLKEPVVRRELTFKEGGPFSRAGLEESRRKLLRLGLLDSVTLAWTEPGGGGTRDVEVRLRERDNLDLALGAGYEAGAGPIGSLFLGRRGIAGKDLSASLQVALSGQESHARLNVGVRRVRGGSSDLLGTLSWSEEKHDAFLVDRTMLSPQLARQVSPNWNALYRVALEDIRVRDLDLTVVSPEEEDEGVIGSIGGTLARYRRDRVLRPASGSIDTLDLTLARGLRDSQAQYARFYAQLVRTWTLPGSRWVYRVASRIGVLWSFADGRVPSFARFFAGGTGTMRGFETDGLGPRDPGTGNPTGGEALLLVNQEVRRAVGRRLHGCVFLDSGNVYRSLGDLSSLRVRNAAGVGVGVGTPVGPLRLYYGWKLDRRPEESAGEFHFTIGSEF